MLTILSQCTNINVNYIITMYQYQCQLYYHNVPISMLTILSQCTNINVNYIMTMLLCTNINVNYILSQCTNINVNYIITMYHYQWHGSHTG